MRRGHGADGLHRRLSRAAAHPPRSRRRRAADSGLVPSRHAAAAPGADRRRPGVRRPGARGREGGGRREAERLRWRLWNGKAKDAGISIGRIRAVMHHFRIEPDGGRSIAPPSRRMWTALRALDDYLVGQSDWLVDYGERHHAGLRVGTALTEGTANFLVNRRMSKSQQMRWSRRGADRLLQVRCAVYNGTLGTGFGQRFYAANDALPKVAAAA